ncbi:MAG: MFS transporter [Proteobacteria bacterium]|nr:MFS transporter [Pseudomonadota bacterium]MBU4296244.1 MFS transporter [Pseudomonadota bacterium]
MTSSQPSNPESIASTKGFYRRLPRGIWVLGFVSMFMDISSELVHSLLPIFMTTVLGASMVTIGIVEGVAEGAAAITKVFSGAISDYFGKRKLLAVVGYALGAMTKPIFPLATTIGWVFGARFVDRIGKGIRGAPRDALVADFAPPHLWGAAYGLRQSLDSVGAFVGPLLAFTFMIWLANDIKAVLWVAVVPAFVAVFLLIVAVHEPDSSDHAADPRNHLTLADAKRLPLRYWLVVALGAIFTLARFSEAFLLLRAQDVGLAVGYVPTIMIVMNIVYSIFAYPAGSAADRFSARTLLLFGLGVLIAADVMLAIAASPELAFLGSAFWGLHMAFTQGLLSKLVADTAPAELRGTAFGIFYLASGGALLLASVIAGSLWSVFGASATFIAGASFAALAAMGLLLYHPNTRTTGHKAGT